MEISVIFQARQAMAAVLLGMCAGFLYDIFRSIRYRFSSRAVTLVTDGIFWIICTFALFLFGMTVTGGRQRAFIFAAAAAGFALYLWIFSCIGLPVCQFIVRIVSSVVGLLLIPLKFAAKISKKVKIFVKKLFSNLQNSRIMKGVHFQIRKPKSSARRSGSRKGAVYDEVKTRRYHY